MPLVYKKINKFISYYMTSEDLQSCTFQHLACVLFGYFVLNCCSSDLTTHCELLIFYCPELHGNVQ